MKQWLKKLLMTILCFSMILIHGKTVYGAQLLDVFRGIGSQYDESHISTKDTNAMAVRAGIDITTKGHWENKYGNDSAILYGYNYLGEKDSSGKRFLVDHNKYDVIEKTPTGDYLSKHSYDIAGNLWCFVTKQSDDSVLDLPKSMGREKFNAYTASGRTGNTIPSGYYRAKYEFNITDEEYHQFSIYGNQKATKDIYITILDKETNKTLLTDTLSPETFFAGTYVTYLVPGSFIMYIDKPETGFGITGCFFDTVTKNMTYDLSSSTGTSPRSVRLNWMELEEITSGTEVMIDRRLGDEVVWQEIATLNSGVGEYQDENLQAGKTYTYRLRTRTGTSYSLAGTEVCYVVPSYDKTVLSFEHDSYTVESSEEKVNVQLTLQKVDGSACKNQKIDLVVDFKHHKQFVESVTTNERGIAVFDFQPDYMGGAQIQAHFADNDLEKLMGASQTASLYVGEQEWSETPILWKVSDAILPDDLITLNGYGLKAENMNDVVIKYAPHSTDKVSSLPPNNAKILENVQMDLRDGYYLVTQLPAKAKPGLYDIWVSNEIGWSEPITLNAARPLFISEYEVWNGQNIEISGRNLSAKQFGSKTDTKVRLNDGIKSYEQFVAKLTPYSITFTVVNTPLGKYQVEVSNDNGITWCTLSSEQILTVVEVGNDPLDIGVAWMDHFAWDNIFDVTEYGATGNDTSDDTKAIHAAINAAKKTKQYGGVIYFPNGNYYISGLKIPANIVLLGEDMNNTILTYCGTGTHMFESTDDGRILGQQGFAKFSVRLSDNSSRPDTFFWLGHAWDASAKDVSLRKASEFFLKQINLTYVQEKDDQRGLGVVLIGDERFWVQDCIFNGYAACMSNIKLNRYSSYRRSSFNYELGYLQSPAMYHFVEECKVTGGWRGTAQADNHGIFGRQSVHMENNYVEEVGSSHNDGEPYCVETPGGYHNYGDVINATNNTVTFIPEQGELKNHYALDYGRLAVRITGGRGMGQQRDVKSIDVSSNTFTINGEWIVNPDSTSTITLICPLDNVTIYNNEQRDSAKGIYLYGCIYDAVVANNTSVDTEGIYVHSAHVKNNRDAQSAYVSIRENILEGISDRTNDCKIGVQSQRTINGGRYYAVSIYGMEIRDNQLTGRRGQSSTGKTEAPNRSGLVSWSAVKSGDKNEDGYCGDNTNIIMENNYLQNLDTAITTTLGDYGVIIKGSRMENVGVPLDNTNKEGTGNLLQMNSYVTPKILANFVSVWSKVHSDDYTPETYARFKVALLNAKAVLELESASDASIVRALQELRITSGSLKMFIKSK